MPRRTPRPAAALLALVISVVLVSAAAAVVVRIGDDGEASTGVSAQPASTSTTATTGAPAGDGEPAPTIAPEPTTAPAGPSSALTPQQARTVDELKTQVSAIRGLQWKGDLPVHIVSPEELGRRVVELNTAEQAKHPEDLVATETMLKLVHVIPAELDLKATIDRLLAGGVLGFYDDETHELFVGGDPEEDLDVATKSTMVHELNHALTDQHFDFGGRDRALTDQDLSQESFALSAVVEGDAELVRTIWTDEHLTARQQVEAELGGGADPSVYFEMPTYILDSLFFPYLNGFEFVSALHDDGGFAAVDTAYRQPPTSTEEILHPDLYGPGRSWARPALPDLAALSGCTAVDTSTIGEFDLSRVLDEQLPEAEALRAAAGWNGDAYGLVRCGTAVGMVARWRGDTPGDLTELADALGRWARGWSGSDRAPDADGRFSGPSGSGRIIRSGDRVDLVIAEDASTSDRLIAAALAA